MSLGNLAPNLPRQVRITSELAKIQFLPSPMNGASAISASSYVSGDPHDPLIISKLPHNPCLIQSLKAAALLPRLSSWLRPIQIVTLEAKEQYPSFDGRINGARGPLEVCRCIDKGWNTSCPQYPLPWICWSLAWTQPISMLWACRGCSFFVFSLPDYNLYHLHSREHHKLRSNLLVSLP